MINVETRQAYSEVNKILKLIGNTYSSKIPSRIKSVFKREMDKNYIPNIDITKPISEQNLKRKTIVIISALNLEYWCTDENEKHKLKKMYCENGIKHQQELNEKYSTDNLFKNRHTETIVENAEETAMTVYGEMPLFKRIFIKIKTFFTGHKK